jgi:hypothetical protein
MSEVGTEACPSKIMVLGVAATGVKRNTGTSYVWYRINENGGLYTV